MNLKVAAIISVFFLIGGLLTFSQQANIISGSPPQPCEEPLTYRLGDIDPRFNISKEELAETMKEVEALWATALDKDLLDYSSDGRVLIHLVYSEEQKRTEEERSFSKRIEIKEGQIKTLQSEYERYSERYKEKRADFQSTANEYNGLIEEYNNFAEKWDGKNVTSQAKNHFEQMERHINRAESELNRKERNLESLRRQTNAKSRQLHALVEEQNALVANYNARFSNPRKFDQGRYIKHGESERINIYQFANHAQLKTVLAHEAGHAFGLGHVDNPKSIMHEMMEEQNIFDLKLTEEDTLAIKKRCNN